MKNKLNIYFSMIRLYISASGLEHVMGLQSECVDVLTASEIQHDG